MNLRPSHSLQNLYTSVLLGKSSERLSEYFACVQQNIEQANIETPEVQTSQDSIATRDAKLFKRQCAILDDLL